MSFSIYLDLLLILKFHHAIQDSNNVDESTNSRQGLNDDAQFVESVAPAPEQIVRLPCSPTLSNPSLFHCRSNKRSKHFCIPKQFVCDGEFDCGDGSDEEGCDDGIRRYKRGALSDTSVPNWGLWGFSIRHDMCINLGVI